MGLTVKCEIQGAKAVELHGTLQSDSNLPPVSGLDCHVLPLVVTLHVAIRQRSLLLSADIPLFSLKLNNGYRPWSLGEGQVL